jgi:hypothetical protein
LVRLEKNPFDNLSTFSSVVYSIVVFIAPKPQTKATETNDSLKSIQVLVEDKQARLNESKN